MKLKPNIIIVGAGIGHSTLARLVDVDVTIVKQEPIEFKIKAMELDWMENVKIDDFPRNKFFDKPRRNYRK
jgi:hypothetical protein